MTAIENFHQPRRGVKNSEAVCIIPVTHASLTLWAASTPTLVIRWSCGATRAGVEAAQRVSEAWVTGIIQTASLFLTPRLGWWKFSIAVMDTSLCMNMKFVRSVGRVSRLKGGGMIVQLGNT